MKRDSLLLTTLIIHIALLTNPLHAQEYKLFVASSPSNAIQLKWMSKNIGLQASFDIYRKSSDNPAWTKINEKPIQRARPLSEAELDKLPETEENYALAQYSAAFLDVESEHKNNYKMLLFTSILNNKLAEYCGIYFIDKSIEKSKTYTYKLTDASNKEFAVSASIQYGADENYSAIENLQANSGNKSIFFNWLYRSEFPFYKLYRSDGKKIIIIPSNEDIQASKQNKFPFSDRDTNLVVGQTYTYQVVGMDYFQRETPKSNSVSAIYKDLTPPPAPQGLRVEYKADNFFHITWREIDKRHVVQTNLYKSQAKKGPYQKIYTGDSKEYDDRELKEESDYYYVVEAINKNGVSAYTDTVQANVPDLTPPAIPKNVKAMTDTGYIKLSWDANTEKDILGYYVFRALSSEEGNFTPLFPDPIQTNYFEDRHAKEVQNKIVYKICAVDKRYNRSKHTEPIFVQMPDITAPTGVHFLEIDAEEKKAKLSWTKCYEPDFKEYILLRGTHINDSTYGNFSPITQTDQTSFTDQTAEPNTRYQYALFVRDSAGNSSDTSYRECFTKAKKIEERIENFQAEKSEQSIKLSWFNPKQIPVQVLRKEDEGSFIPISSWKNSSSMEDTEVKKGSIYMYKILTEGEEDDWESQEIKIEF